MNKRETLSAILHLKCPKCHEGNLFSEKNPFKLKALTDMPVQCPVCKLSFNPEPGFYWGALYVSYGMAVCFSLVLFAVMYLIWGWTIWPFVIADTIFLILLAPPMLRYSRVLYVYINYKLFPNSWNN